MMYFWGILFNSKGTERRNWTLFRGQCSASGLVENMRIKEIRDRFRTDGIQFAVDGYTDALLAVTQAERAAQVDFVTQLILGDKGLQLLDDGTGSLQVAG
jgi:hypothetical protein